MASGHVPARHALLVPGGRGGIRTRGALFRHTAFRERHHKPLGHPSARQYSIGHAVPQATSRPDATRQRAAMVTLAPVALLVLASTSTGTWLIPTRQPVHT